MERAYRVLTRCGTASTELVLTGGRPREGASARSTSENAASTHTEHAPRTTPLTAKCLSNRNGARAQECEDVPDGTGHSRWRLEKPNVHTETVHVPKRARTSLTAPATVAGDWKSPMSINSGKGQRIRRASDHKRRVQHGHAELTGTCGAKEAGLRTRIVTLWLRW